MYVLYLLASLVYMRVWYQGFDENFILEILRPPYYHEVQLWFIEKEQWRSRCGPWYDITQKLAFIFSDDNGAVKLSPNKLLGQPKCLLKIATKFLFISWIFLLTDWLMDRLTDQPTDWLISSDKQSSITAYDVASAQEVPFGILQCIQCILHAFISLLLCVLFIFTAKGVSLMVHVIWLLCITEIIHIFQSD